MARTKPQQGTVNGSAVFDSFMDVGNYLTAQAILSWQAGEEMLGETETFLKRWLDRRYEANRAAVTAVDRMKDAGPDFSERQRALLEWQATSAGLLYDDVSDWFALWAECANHLATEEIEAGAELMDMAEGKKRKLPTRIPV